MVDSGRHITEHSTSLPNNATEGCGPNLNKVLSAFTYTPPSSVCTPVSTPSPNFMLTGPGEAEALVISVPAIAETPASEAEAWAWLQPQTHFWALARNTPETAYAPALGRCSPGLSVNQEVLYVID